MSIESWKEEFGRTRSRRIEGLRPENLKKHDVKVSGGMLHELRKLRGGSYQPIYKSVFPNGFDDLSVLTERQQKAYQHWLKTNDAAPLIKSFTPSLLDKLRSLFSISLIHNISVLL